MKNKIFILTICLLLTGCFESQSLSEVNSKYGCGVMDENNLWPWLGKIIFSNYSSFFPATIISEYYVLTTSENRYDRPQPDFLSGFFQPQIGSLKTIQRQIRHPTAQLTLLELAYPIQFSNKVRPICLPGRKEIFSIFNQQTFVVSFHKSKNEFMSTLLRTLPKCEIADPNVYCSMRSNNRNCHLVGSGVMSRVNNKWFLNGITTYQENIEPCNPDLPVYNLNMYKFLSWIKNKMVKTIQKFSLQKYNSDKSCGISTMKPLLRIVNGQEAVPNSWPWLVPIISYKNNQPSSICGGTIISEKFVLTAAHCLDITIERSVIELGTHILGDINYHNVKRWIIHRNYNKIAIRNDIALLELEKPINFTDKVKKACLPLTNDVKTVFSKKVYFAGWGTTIYNGPFPGKLLQTNFTIINYKDDLMCNSQDSEYYCAFNKDSSVCNGDSGGGLFYQMNNQWYVYGIASFTDFDENGLGCPLKRPQYHTMVPNYLLWIKKAMEHAFSPYDKYSFFNYV